jgi:hypothetical protein
MCDRHADHHNDCHRLSQIVIDVPRRPGRIAVTIDPQIIIGRHKPTLQHLTQPRAVEPGPVRR